MTTYRAGTVWVVGTFVLGFLLITALLLSNMSVYILGPGALAGMIVVFAAAALGRMARWVSRARRTPKPSRAMPSTSEPQFTKASAVTGALITGDLATSLGRVDIFRELSREQLQAVASLAEEAVISQGETLGRRGEPGDALYAILEGHVEFTAGVGEPEITLRVAGPGEALPLACILGDGRLVTTVQAITDIRALRFPRHRLTELCMARPDIGVQIYRAIAEVAMARYQRTVGRLTDTVAYALDQVDFWANV